MATLIIYVTKSGGDDLILEAIGSTVTPRSFSSREEKDLGVTVDNLLNFKQHVRTQTYKANKLLFMVRRTCTYLDVDSLPTLYKTIFRPHLEYCNVV